MTSPNELIFCNVFKEDTKLHIIPVLNILALWSSFLMGDIKLLNSPCFVCNFVLCSPSVGRL